MMNTATRPTFTIKVNPELMDIKWGDVVWAISYRPIHTKSKLKKK